MYCAVYETKNPGNGAYKKIASEVSNDSNFPATLEYQGIDYKLHSVFIVNTPSLLEQFKSYCQTNNIEQNIIIG